MLVKILYMEVRSYRKPGSIHQVNLVKRWFIMIREVGRRYANSFTTKNREENEETLPWHEPLDCKPTNKL